MVANEPLQCRIPSELKRRAERAARRSRPRRSLTFFVVQALERLLQHEAAAEVSSRPVSKPRHRRGGR